jgi:hypothetical protein
MPTIQELIKSGMTIAQAKDAYKAARGITTETEES